MDQERTAQQSAPPEELAHLDRILDMVNQELEEAQRTVEKMDEEYREAQQYLADRRGEDNARDMFQSQQMLSQIDAQGVSVVAHRDRLQKTKASPYFARIDFRSQEEGESAPYYIGLYAFRFQRQLYVIDWRSPSGQHVLRLRAGAPAHYDAPRGPRGQGVGLTLKRQFKIQDGWMEYAFDSSQNIQDDILQKELALHLRREDEVHHLHHPEGAEPDHPG